MNTKPDIILFDLDGTLLDNTHVVVSAYKTGLEKLGLEQKSSEQILSLKGLSTEKTAEHLSVPDEKINQMVEHFISYFRSYSSDPKFQPILFKGVDKFLEWGRSRGIPLAVVTNNDTQSAKNMLKKAEILDFFYCVVGSSDVKKVKPSPEPIIKALSLLAVKYENHRVLFIGDSPTDQEAAKNAGIQFTMVNNEFEDSISLNDCYLRLSGD